MASKKISAKAQKAIDEKRIERAYQTTCSGIQVNVMDLSKISRVGEAAILEGVDDVVLGQRIRDFVETIRQN